MDTSEHSETESDSSSKSGEDEPMNRAENNNSSILMLHSNLKFIDDYNISINDIDFRTIHPQKVITVPLNEYEKIRLLKKKFFPNFFILDIKIENENDKQKILTMLRSKFKKENRPLIVQFSNEGENLIYFKTDDDFKLMDDNEAEFGENFLKLLNISDNFDTLITEILSRNDFLIIRYLRLFEIYNSDDFFNNLMLKTAKNGNIDQLTAAMDMPFNYKNFPASVKVIETLTTIFDDDKSILKAAIEGNKIQNVDLICNYCSKSLDKLDYNHRQSIINLSSDDDILFQLLTTANFPFPARWTRHARYEHDEIFENQQVPGHSKRPQIFRAANRPNVSRNISKITNEEQMENQQEKLQTSHEGIEKLILLRNDFHTAIKSGNFVKVKNSMNSFKSTNMALNSNNQSAVMTALNNKQFEIYSFLRKSNFQLSEIETEKHLRKIERLENYEKDKITNFNIKYSEMSNCNSLWSLISRSSVHMGRHQVDKCHDKIAEIFAEIFDRNEIKIILEIAAKYENLKIIFHFDHDSVDDIDPNESYMTNGLLDNSKDAIFIAAGRSLDCDKSKQKTKGVLIHELCHFVFKNVFENRALPYYQNDTENATKLREIVENYKYWDYIETEISDDEYDELPSDNCDSIIRDVYLTYDPDVNGLQDLELIVRPAQIIARFDDDEETLNKLMTEVYQDIFDFYFSLREELEKFNKSLSNREDTKKLNENIGFYAKLENSPLEFEDLEEFNMTNDFIVLKSEVPILTFISLYQNLHNKAVNSTGIFLSTKKLRNPNIYKKIKNIIKKYSEDVNYQEEPMAIDGIVQHNLHDIPTTLFIHYKNQDFDDNLQKLITKCEPKKLIFVTSVKNSDKFENFVNNLKNSIEFSINCIHQNDINAATVRQNKLNLLEKIDQRGSEDKTYNFEQLTENSQEYLLEKFVEFPKGNKIQFKDLMLQNVKNIVTTEMLNQLCNDEKISFNSNHFLDRKSWNTSIYRSRSISKISEVEESKEITKEEYEAEKNYKNYVNFEELENEKVKVIELIEKRNKISQDRLMTDKNTFILISDIAGNGKSWLLKHIADEIIEEKSIRWTIFVNLKDIYNELGRIDRNNINFAEFIVKNILNPQDYSAVDIEIFKDFYNTGRASFLFDGFDEIYPERATNAILLMKSLHDNCGNQLWITTRNHTTIEEKLKKNLNLKTFYSLKTLSDDECLTFLVTMLEEEEKKKGKPTNECQEEEREKVDLDLNSLISCKGLNIKSDHEKENLINFGASTSRLKRKSTDEMTHEEAAKNLLERIKDIKRKSIIGLPQLLYTIAECFGGDYQNSKKEKSEISNFTLYAHLNNLHELRFLEKFPNQLKNNSGYLNYTEVHQFFAMKEFFPSKQKFCDLEIELKDAEIFIYNGGVANFQHGHTNFLHETFLEFFVSDFIRRIVVKKLWQYHEDFFTLFFDILYGVKFNVVRSFIDDQARENSFIIAENNEDFAAKMLKILKPEEKVSIIVNLVDEKLENLLEFFLNILKMETNENIKNIFSQIIKETYRKPGLIPYTASQSKLMCVKIMKFLIFKLDSENLESFIISNQILHEILTFSSEADILGEIVGELKLKLTISQFFKVLKSENQEDCNLLQNVCNKTYSFNLEHFNETWNVLQSNLTPAEFSELLEMKSLKEKSKTFLHFCAFFKPSALYCTLFDLLRSVDNFYVLMEMKDIDGNTFLHHLVTFGSYGDVLMTFKNLKILLGDKFKDFLRIDGYNEKHLMQCSVHRQQDVTVHNFIWETMRNEFGEEEFLKTLMKPDIQGDNIFHTVAAFSTFTVFDNMIIFLLKNGFNNQIPVLLNAVNDRYGRNILQIAASFNSSINLYNCLWNTVEKFVDDQDIFDMITKFDHYNNNLKQLARRNSEEIFQFTCDKIKFHLKEE